MKVKVLVIFVLIFPGPSWLFAQNEVAVFKFVAEEIDVDAEMLRFLKTGSAAGVESVLSNYLVVVERKELNSIIKNLKIELSGLFDAETVIPVGKMVGAKYSVIGSWVKLRSFLVLTVRIVDNETASIIASEEQRVDLDDTESILDLPSNAATSLLSRLNVSHESISRITQSKEALLSYSKAVEAYDKGDSEEADKFAREALREDPEFEEVKQYIYYIKPENVPLIHTRGYNSYWRAGFGITIPLSGKTETEVKNKIIGAAALNFLVNLVALSVINGVVVFVDSLVAKDSIELHNGMDYTPATGLDLFAWFTGITVAINLWVVIYNARAGIINIKSAESQ